MITRDQMLAIMPYAANRIDTFIPHLIASMDEFEINTQGRRAAFLAQLGHESGQFRYMEEIADGSAYDGRVDLGNTRPEAIRIAHRNGTTPGRFWKGHGPIQITGYHNHLAMMMALGIDCLENPRLLCEPQHGCRSAAQFWHSHGLNALADTGNFLRITKIINGGYNHYKQRLALYDKAREVLA